MSTLLEKIEQMSYEDSIVDKEVIDNVVNDVLNLDYSGLNTNSGHFTNISFDLACGYEVIRERVEEMTVREILTLISSEPGNEYFLVDDDEEYWMKPCRLEEDFCCSYNCFYLAGLFIDSVKTTPEIGRFMKINLYSFMLYTAQKKTGKRLTRLSNRGTEYINDIYYGILREMGEYGNVILKREPKTIGDWLSTLFRVGSWSWQCGEMRLQDFAERTIRSYDFLKQIFMDCITCSLIQPEERDFWTIVDKCRFEITEE